MPDAVSAYRQVLAAAEDRWVANIDTNILANIGKKYCSLLRSIVIAAIGFATNIADLLRSGADDHSPLSGKTAFGDFLFGGFILTKSYCTFFL